MRRVRTRLTGQAGAFEVGFYQIGTAKQDYYNTFIEQDVTVPSEAFTVTRVRRKLWEQSAIGAIYTLKRTSQDTGALDEIDQHTAGIDLDFKTRNFLTNKNLELEAFFVWNSNPRGLADPGRIDLGVDDLSAHVGA